MKHTHTRIHRFIALAALAMASAAAAQTGVDAAQMRYDQEIARCNSGNLPAPARAGCVRNAGLALDRARGGPPTDVPMTTPDGRSTVIAPAGSARPRDDSSIVTSPDGRATIVLPAGGSTPR